MLEKLSTEARNKETMDLDLMSIHQILEKMNQEDTKVPQVISNEISNIEQTVKMAIYSVQQGGRFIYLGAGTSGRLGILDAVECMPTFSASSDVVIGLIAGGKKAFTEAVEGVEDHEYMGADDLASISLTKKDLVIGIAASGRTPYVIGGIQYARKIGAKTAGISCNKHAILSKLVDIAIELDTGPEVLTGSTRLKAGTAQKLVLNMISTATMIGIGKVYKNLMVDVQSTNKKLTDRSKRIIMQATGIDAIQAEKYFKESHHNVKIAILMILLHCSFKEAEKRLQSSNGFIRKALEKHDSL
jgi:N-acetylmuramic acid 6-phosphate etherase